MNHDMYIINFHQDMITTYGSYFIIMQSMKKIVQRA